MISISLTKAFGFLLTLIYLFLALLLASKIGENTFVLYLVGLGLIVLLSHVKTAFCCRLYEFNPFCASFLARLISTYA